MPAWSPVTLTDRTVAVFGLPWGPYPWTIHSAGWGIFFNLLVTLILSFGFPDSGSDREKRGTRHRFLQAVSGIPEEKRKHVPLAWALTLIWFLVGFGPFAVVGNILFSDPNQPATWAPFDLPSLWVWQLVMLAFGIFVMWFLAFHIGLSKPVPPERVEAVYKEHFGEGDSAQAETATS